MLAMIAVAKPLTVEGAVCGILAVAVAVLVLIAMHLTCPGWSWERPRR